MFSSLRRLSVAAALVTVLYGCGELRTTTDIQLDHIAQMRESYGDHFTYMVDNAILSDMSLADMHFVAHSSELSGVGAKRLERMAKLLNTYGGAIRYETTLSNQAMLDARIANVREFLALAGCEIDPVDIAIGAPGGRVMSGQEAVARYQRATTVSDNQADTGILPPSGN